MEGQADFYRISRLSGGRSVPPVLTCRRVMGCRPRQHKRPQRLSYWPAISVGGV